MKRMLALLLVAILCMTSVALAEGDRNIMENPNNPWVEEIVDLGGRTIKFASFWADVYTIMEDEEEETPPEVLKNIQILKDIEEDYNCKIEIVDLDGIEFWTQELYEQFSLAKTSGDTFADIIDWQTNANTGSAMYSILAPLDDLAIIEKNKANFSEVSFLTQFGGKYYGMNTESPNGFMRSFLLVNKDYLEEYGVGSLYDIVRNGEWTFDKFMEVCETVYNKSGGEISGLVKRYGMPNDLFIQFMTSNNAVPFAQKDGKLVAQHATEQGIRACQFVVELINKGLLDMEYIDNPDDPYDYFIAGKSLFYIAEGWEIGSVAEELPGDMGLVPMPKGPDAENYASYLQFLRVMSIVDNGDGGEAAAHVLTAFKKRQADIYLDYEDEPTEEELNETYDWIADDMAYDFTDDDSIEMTLLTYQGLTMDYQVLLEDVPGWGDAAWKMAHGAATPAEALGAIAQELQAAVDAINNN